MTRLLEEARTIIKRTDYDSDTESDDGSDTESPEVTQSRSISEIRHHITLLMNLLPSLQHVLEYSIREERDKQAVIRDQFQVSKAASAYISIVREKFARAEDDLVARLGEANWQRHIRIRKRLEQCAQETFEPEVEIPIAKSLFRPISTFHDSGLGKSISAATVRIAASVVSHSSFRTSATEGGIGSLRVPETPEEVALGLAFQCSICGKTLTTIKDRYQWKYAYSSFKF